MSQPMSQPMTQIEWTCTPRRWPHEGRFLLMARCQHKEAEAFATGMVSASEELAEVAVLLERAIAKQLFAKAGRAAA